MSARECPAESYRDGLPCGLPAGHDGCHEAKGGGVVWGDAVPAREGRPGMSADDLRAAVERLADEWSTPESHRADAWISHRDVADTLRALLAEHPAPERPAACEICLRAGCRGECRVPAPEPPSEEIPRAIDGGWDSDSLKAVLNG